ncbi:unknown [Feldmannia species virus]|uniref:Uncharacterized protein n=1 Tax=Feldmannia species virus TaxID=39420 RepID=B5LWA9_9PHYC|nr:hypothetical protein FeldSpV_gp020 [Feldmannia species virus]ACH46772.1 unknown [Feldmannia species virus]
MKLLPIKHDEKDFVWTWCRERHLDDVYTVLALTIWIRVKPGITVFFLLDDRRKATYMVACVHIALKYLGYDELAKCDFLRDIRQVDPGASTEYHQNIEIQILEILDWKIEHLVYEG